MIGLFLSLLLLSPSNIERSLSVLENPAGLGIHHGYEFSYVYPENYYLLSFGKSGLGVRYKGDTIHFITGSTIFSFKDRFSTGFGYDGEMERYLIGMCIRPTYGLSIGITGFLKSLSDIYTHIGVSLQPPNSDKITITGRYDIGILPDLTGRKAFVEVYGEPIDGLGMRIGYQFQEKRAFGGLIVSLANLRGRYTGAYSDGISSYNTMITASLTPFPSLMKRFRTRIVVEIEGKYPELPTKRFLKRGKCFLDLLQLLKDIRDTKYVKTVLFVIKNSDLGVAQAEEVEKLIKEISREKRTFAYADQLTLKNLFIASACDSVIIPPSGGISLPGVVVIKSYLKSMLDRIGVEAQFARIGKYKSAVEPLISDTMSTADREQLNAYIKTIVDVMIKGIASSRGIPASELSGLIDTVGYFTPAEAVRYNLVDTLMYLDEVKDHLKIKKKARILHGETVPRALVRGFLPNIAVVVAEGSIVQGKSSEPILPIPIIGGNTVGSETFVSTIKKVMKNPSIKAVVIRVNSPGGDALASDIMWNTIKKLSEKKPVVISMGDVAASGGYYISAGGKKIFADKTTLTGSIGIFGGKFVMEKLYKKIGISHQAVKWGRHADAFADYRKFDQLEKNRLERVIRYGYELFLERVAEGRKMDKDSIDAIGRGHIWSGADGVRIGIVDHNGGLLDAIEEAKKMAGIKGKVGITLYPHPSSFIETLLEDDGNTLVDIPILKLLDSPFLYIEPVIVKLK